MTIDLNSIFIVKRNRKKNNRKSNLKIKRSLVFISKCFTFYICYFFQYWNVQTKFWYKIRKKKSWSLFFTVIIILLLLNKQRKQAMLLH